MNKEIDEETRLKIIKQKARVVCICKGISLGTILKYIDPGDTVDDVNTKCGSGSGGCKGERCRYKIEILIKKKEDVR